MAGTRRKQAAAIGMAIALVLGAAAGDAQAQGFGIGPRMVMVSGTNSPLEDTPNASSAKLTGGFMRIRASRHMGVELSMDFRTTTDPTNTIKIRQTPIQGSVLFYPFKTAIAPYVMGGVGWYKQKFEAMSEGQTIATTNNSEFGYHTGVGGELMLGKHASIFVDYRYTFINIDGIGGLLGKAMSLTSITGLISSFANTNSLSSDLSGVTGHGSMWTTGMTIYF